jgi:hypothetical protein
MDEQQNGHDEETIIQEVEADDNMVPVPPIILQRLGTKDIEIAVLQQQVQALQEALVEKEAALESLKTTISDDD